MYSPLARTRTHGTHARTKNGRSGAHTVLLSGFAPMSALAVHLSLTAPIVLPSLSRRRRRLRRVEPSRLDRIVSPGGTRAAADVEVVSAEGRA
jgi:hypothetical protein